MQNEPALTHRDVVTLFHEMGHALHHTLTQVDYAAVSCLAGVPWDAVEFPSQLHEIIIIDTFIYQIRLQFIQAGTRNPNTYCNTQSFY